MSEYSTLDEEPVFVFLGGLAGIVAIGLGAATALDWLPLTAQQTTAIAGFVTAVTAFAASVLRSRVWSPATVANLQARAAIDVPGEFP
jgi:hypothetical protein